jgi:hypothetical protein
MKVTPAEASAATALLVAGATWLGARINSSTQAKRERKARADERRQVFEQETLVRLQDALDDPYRIVEETGLKRFLPTAMTSSTSTCRRNRWTTGGPRPQRARSRCECSMMTFGPWWRR